MSDQFWLTKAQLKRIEIFFPRTRGIPRVDDQCVVSGIVHVIRNGLRWRDAPERVQSTKILARGNASAGASSIGGSQGAGWCARMPRYNR
jgi:transposase